VLAAALFAPKVMEIEQGLVMAPIDTVAYETAFCSHGS
jgi:hypothetical protein